MRQRACGGAFGRRGSFNQHGDQSEISGAAGPVALSRSVLLQPAVFSAERRVFAVALKIRPPTMRLQRRSTPSPGMGIPLNREIDIRYRVGVFPSRLESCHSIEFRHSSVLSFSSQAAPTWARCARRRRSHRRNCHHLPRRHRSRLRPYPRHHRRPLTHRVCRPATAVSRLIQM